MTHGSTPGSVCRPPLLSWREALAATRTTRPTSAAKIEKTVPDILVNQLNSSLANASAARKAIAKIVEPTLKRVTAATDYAHAAIQILIAKTDLTAPTDLMLAMQHQEVRAALLHMSDVERRKAIANAISAGDETFVACCHERFADAVRHDRPRANHGA